MIARELKEKLRRRETQVGTFVKLADPTAMEVLGLAGDGLRHRGHGACPL